MTQATSRMIGTAGWSIPKDIANSFPREGSTLSRYAQRFPCVEINTSFYRSHRPTTYARWRASVPASFRFAVKLPKTISHVKRLIDVEHELCAFLDETSELGGCRGPLLLQLPPSFAFDAETVEGFFALLRGTYGGDFVIEPRNSSWFVDAFMTLLHWYSTSLVIADPSQGFMPSMAPSAFRYFRLHGSPRVYYSAYQDTQLHELRDRLVKGADRCWIIFDNTASGAAAGNALDLMAMIADA